MTRFLQETQLIDNGDGQRKTMSADDGNRVSYVQVYWISG